MAVNLIVVNVLQPHSPWAIINYSPAVVYNCTHPNKIGHNNKIINLSQTYYFVLIKHNIRLPCNNCFF